MTFALMLMPESIPKLIAQSSACDVTEMLHSWWLAEGHLDRLQSQHRIKVQDVEKHREAALEYLKYFESTLLPSKTSDAPKGTRLERVEELWGYRFGSVQHYDRLKAWLHEGEHRLDFIKAHLACTLAALQGGQVNMPDGIPQELHGREADLHQALHDLLHQHHKSLLEWKDSQKPKSSADSVARASKEVRSEESLRLAKATAQQSADSQTGYPNADANSKADDKASSPPQDGADAQDSTQAKQAGHQLGKGNPGDTNALQHRLEYEQERVRRLEARLEDAKRTSEYHRLEMQKMLASTQAGKRASKLSEEACAEGEQREEQLKQENKRILSELEAARQAARQAEYLALQQAMEIERVHLTKTTLAQVNGNLQAQVSALQGDNISFQRRVSSLQDTTSSLSTQISALAQQAQAASSVGNQVQVLKSVAATLQRERDYAKNAAAKAERGNQTLSLKVADLARQLKNASSQIKSLSKDGGSLNHGDNPKDDDTFKDGGTPRQEDIVSKNKVKTEFGSSQQKQAKAESSNTAVTQADAHGALLMPDQVAAYEATIKQLQDKLQAGESKYFKLEQDNKQLHRDLKAAKGIKQEVHRMQADLIKSAQCLDSVAPHSAPAQGSSQTLPAPQISPASPPQPRLSLA